VVNTLPRPLYHRERDPVPIVQEAGWALAPVWTFAENLAPSRIRSPDRPTCSESLYLLLYPSPPQIVLNEYSNGFTFHAGCIREDLILIYINFETYWWLKLSLQQRVTLFVVGLNVLSSVIEYV